MRIGILGAGHIGATLARKFTAAGHEVAIANSRDPDTLRDLDQELGEQGHAAAADQAAAFGDVVVVAIPFGRYRELPVDPCVGKIVIDTNNYYAQRDGHFPELDEDRTTSSELLHEHLGQVRMVKAFNAVRWDRLRDNSRKQAPRHGVPISGDDQDAKRTVASLIDEIGFEAVDAGDLAHGGRKHQPGTSVYAADLLADELRTELGTTPPYSGGHPPRHDDWADRAAAARTADDPRVRTSHDERGVPTPGGGRPAD